MSLVRSLHYIQDEYGYLPDDALFALAQRLGIKPYRLLEVVSFFPHFRRQEPPPVKVFVCRDMACHLAGASKLATGLQELPQAKSNQRLVVEGVSCLGRCDRSPVVCVERFSPRVQRPDAEDEAARAEAVAARAALTEGFSPHPLEFWARRNLSQLQDLVTGLYASPPHLDFDSDETYAVATNEWTIDVYATDRLPPFAAAGRLIEALGRDGALAVRPGPPAESPPKPSGKERRNYTNMRGYLKRHYPASVCEVLERVDRAGLRGMGGGGQLAFEKWMDVLVAPGDTRYVVANGDESEPGTFKDRELLVRAPHLVVEGVIVAGLILGAERGYIYVRHEYSEGIAKLNEAIRAAEAAGVCGAIQGTTRKFAVEVFISPGGYICGEQSALLEAMEDRRAEPRNRPPELATNGLRDRPTLVTNVETLAWLPAIELKGGEWYADRGCRRCFAIGKDRPGVYELPIVVPLDQLKDPDKPARHRGRRLFSISGDVLKPGVYELPVGAPLRRLVMDCAGGMRDPEQPLKAIATSGPSGGFVPSRFTKRNGAEVSLLDLPLDIDSFREVDLALGAGLVVYDASRNLVEPALNCTEFFRNESCGKCVPCRIGSQKLVEIGDSLREKGLADNQFQVQQELIDRLAETMELASICGLGVVAPNPLSTLLNRFSGDLLASGESP